MQPGTYGPVSKLTGCRHDSGIVVTKINIIMTTIKALKTQYYLRPSEASYPLTNLAAAQKRAKCTSKIPHCQKCRRETAAFALAFRPVSESSRPTSTSHISPVRYPIPSQEAGNAGDSSGVASVDGRR
ncbi:hypothetical protein EVAR_56829_1 [Eumeta japonica]|uniref:Uncharacterized protein n=1 Tax=Eumeta variegata TaxID=151549 RepID=A0A4C1ZGN6_EUMVA|nr:hypothetical protein EVAR_56829_1 [Eumeta japonica]